MKSDIFDSQFDEQHGVLKNSLRLTNPHALELVIADVSRVRVVQLEQHPLRGKFDIPHLQAIHRHIFQDVFPWAGDFREVRTSRSDSFGFPPPQFLIPSLNDLFTKLSTERPFRSLDTSQIANRLAHYLGELNAIHPFREGNGRAHREFIRTVALEAGWRLSWAGLTQEENDRASQISFARGDNSHLAALILPRLSREPSS